MMAGFMDKVLDSVKDWSLGDVLGGAGALFSAYSSHRQNKMANKYLQQQLELNKSIIDEERERRRKADANLAAGYSNSLYGRGLA